MKIDRTIVHIWCVCFLTIRVHGQANICDVNVEFLVNRGFELNGHTIWESKTKDILECARSCIRWKTCSSFNYHEDSSMCQLSSDIGIPTATSSKHILYSDIEKWPSQVDPECFKRPCNEDETCVPGFLVGNTAQCTYSCLSLARTCPLPAGSTSDQSRTVGSIYTHTCDRGFVGGDSARCLPSGTWNKTMNTSCHPLFGSECNADTDCDPINGICNVSICTCREGYAYNKSAVTCGEVCETDWMQYQESDMQYNCYLFGNEDMSYEKAKVFCSNRRSQLVYVETKEENEFLVDKMNETGPDLNYWNALYQFSSNKMDVKWDIEGGPMDPAFLRWGNTEPNGVTELCTAFYSPANFEWADVKCTNEYRPACKKTVSFP